ncbi:MAG: ABC transporter substrate-binding protein [Deltaproteobacteria bacterium]|nr:ABC transporter substrate-binding protein [Deltaproteobacteria bacterium]
MKIGRRITLAALWTMLLVFFAGCGPKASQPLEKIVTGSALTIHTSPVWIAESKGYFREEGLQVEIKTFESGRTALRTMLNAGGLDLVTAARGPVVFNSFTRNDYAVIGCIDYSDNDHQVLARRDRGIKAPADLKGKTIGITAGSSSHFLLGLFLPYYQLQMTDVKLIDMEPARLAQGLKDGRIDVTITWDPFSNEARKALGDKALLLPSKGLYRMDFFLIARKDFIKKRPETLKRFLRAIEKSETFMLNNREVFMIFIVQNIKMDRKVVTAAWDDFRFRLFLDQSLLTSMEDEARWAIRNRLTDSITVPNYLEYIHTAALKAVKPGVVGIAGR